MIKAFLIRFVCLFSLLFIMSCSTAVEKTKYYRLEGEALNNTISTCGQDCTKLLVNIIVPDYLNSNGIVYYSDSMDLLTVANKNLWIEELGTQLTKILTNKINNKFNKYYAFDQRTNLKNDSNLQIFMQKFNGEKDGKLIISGTYVFKHKDLVKQGSFEKVEIQKDNGFDSLVLGLNQLWLNQCDILIKDLL